MLRVSLQKNYETYWSGDPALEQLAKDAPESAVKAHDAKLKHARLTGDWSALILEGKAPTKFVLKPLPGDIQRKIQDYYAKTNNGLELLSLAFRSALVDIVGLESDGPSMGPALNIEHAKDPEYPVLGKIAPVKLANDLDAIDPSIISELGSLILTKGSRIDPL